ncbi:unnamed protein product [Brassicogethes aeneus]|uniref:Uncharacterized protein n=1 Tax=Brassicogethes aeneus TaxID=1431903 RepID=A0A9P0BHQ6_BRAAE|nr:unnamed protein product [Brassicogethes aeneus]
MSFIELIERQRSNLKNEDFVASLYNDMLTEKECEDQENLIQYFLHTEPDQVYMQNLVSLLEENAEEIVAMVPDLKAYLLTFLKFCMRKEEPCYSKQVRLLAATLYIKLISISAARERFLKNQLLSCCITVAIDVTDKEALLHQLVNALFSLVVDNVNDINPIIAQVVNGAFCVIIIRNSKQPLITFDNTDLVSKCFLYIKNIIQLERHDDAFILATLSPIFHPLLKTYYTLSESSTTMIVVRNFQVFISKLIIPKLNDKQQKHLVSAFIKVWDNPDFVNFDDAVLFLNKFPIDSYTEAIRKMGLFLLSKNHEPFHVNMLNLFLATLSRLPEFSEREKVLLAYELALRYNVMLCHDTCKNPKKAIEILCRICQLHSPAVHSIICNYVNKDSFETISLTPLLRYFLQSTRKKWVSGVTTNQITTIVCIMISNANEIRQQLVYELLHALCWDSTPFSLKPSLYVLEELFLKLKSKKENVITKLIMKIFLKMALHTDATSQEYVTHIYNALFRSKTINNIVFSCNNYIDALLEEEEQLEAFFEKCTKLRLIKPEHVEMTINAMDFENEAQLLLLKHLISYTKYKEVRTVCQYTLANLRNIILSENFKHILFIYYTILVNMKGNFMENELSEMEAIYSNLYECVAHQKIRIESFQNAYVVLKKSQLYLQILDNTIFEDINRSYMEKLESALFGERSITQLYFASELMLRGKILATDKCRKKIAELTTYEGLLQIKENEPELWFPLLHLAETLTMMKKSGNLEHILRTINMSMRSGKYTTTHKIYLLKVLHTLSEEITRDFEDLILYSFQELADEDMALKKLVSTFVEELVEKEYLKLTSEQYFLFVIPITHPDGRYFVKDLLTKRFVFSQASVIARHFVSFILYMNVYKHESHPITDDFKKVIKKLRPNIAEDRQDCYNFMFVYLPVKYKMNILTELNEILMQYVNLKLQHTNKLILLLEDLLFIYKISSYVEDCTISEVFKRGIKIIKKEWRKNDTENATAELNINPDTHNKIIKVIQTLMITFFFNEEEHRNVSFRKKLFYLILHWIVAYKPNVLHSIQHNDDDDLNTYFNKLDKFYAKYKDEINQHAEF